jgi:hypothetical protein
MRFKTSEAGGRERERERRKKGWGGREPLHRIFKTNKPRNFRKIVVHLQKLRNFRKSFLLS